MAKPQKFIVEVEYAASNKGYTAEEVKELLVEVWGMSYDTAILSVEEVTADERTDG